METKLIRCCKCHDHKWITAEKIVHTEAQDRDYCLWHAPEDAKKVDGKSISVATFNMLFRAEAVKKYTESGKTGFHMHGVVFPGDIDITEFIVNSCIKKFTLNGSTFCGNVFFRDCVIGQADMAEAEFRGEVYFSRTVFQKSPSFVRARFCKRVDFSETEFREGASFNGAEFKAPAWFTKSVFGGNMIFNATRSDDNAIRMQQLASKSLSNVIYSSLEARNFSFCACEPWPDRFGYEQNERTSDLQLEELYRAMKQKAMDACDMPMASQWHAKEKEMSLRQIQASVEGWSFERIKRWVLEQLASAKARVAAVSEDQVRTAWRVFQEMFRPDSLLQTVFGSRLLRVTWWYKLSSGFGENPAQAVRVLVALVALVLGLMAFSTMRSAMLNGGTDPEFGERIYAALQHLLFITTPQYAPESAFLRSLLLVLTRLVIPVQTALFGFAMFNRFRR